MTSISIAMATYNGGLFIADQLKSLSAQAHLPSELVVCDDLSCDDTHDIVERYARSAPFPVRSYRNDTRLGYGANFMKAASLCNSDVIAFCDQDDVWRPDKLAKIADAFLADRCIAAYHDLTIVDKDNKIITWRHKSPAPGDIDPWSVMPGLSLAFRRTILNHGLWGDSVNHRRPDERMAHDQWICFVAQSIGGLTRLADPLVRYRQHDNNAFGIFYSERRSALRRIVEYVRLSAENLIGKTHDVHEKRRFWHAIAAGNREGARSRIGILRRLLADAPDFQRGQIAEKIAYYEGVANTLALRLPAYEETGKSARARALFGAVMRGAYQGGDAGLKELLQDSFFGVLVSSPPTTKFEMR